MSLANDGTGNMVMPVSPMGGNSGGWGFGNDGGLFWLLVLFLFGFAGNGWGGFGGGNAPMVQNDVQRGFDQNAIMTGINGVNNAVTVGFGNMQNAFSQAEIAANARQMADMQQAFTLQSQLSQCCCDNRLATCQTQNIVQNEAAATRAAIQDQTQAILNQMCNDKIEEKNDIIAQLRSELLYARGQASQDVQTAAIQAGQRNLANEIEQYVAPRAIPAYTVQNPSCCNQTYNCGCGVV